MNQVSKKKIPRENVIPGSPHPSRHPMCPRVVHLKEELAVKLRQCSRTKSKLIPEQSLWFCPVGLKRPLNQWGHYRVPGALYSAGGQCEQFQPGGVLHSLAPSFCKREDNSLPQQRKQRTHGKSKQQRITEKGMQC